MPRAAKKPGTGLTEKQEAFTFQCVRLGSPARAYRKVYNATRMSQHAVWQEVNDLLRNPAIATRVAHFTAIADRAADVSVEKIARELTRVAFFDPREIFDEDGNPIPINELPEDAARVIAGLDVEALYAKDADGVRARAGNVLKYKIANKITALEILAKWKQMMVERHEIGKPGDFARSPEELDASIRERAAKLGYVPVLVPKKVA